MIAIIPARGGSKGLPGKNIMELNGKPLIAYTIETALNSKQIDRIILSTDDEAIADICRNTGVEIPFMRPKELAQDNSLAKDTYIYTIERLNNEFNCNYSEFIVLQPTSPLRTAADINKAIELFRKRQADSVISVCEFNHPIQWAKKIDNEGKLLNFFNKDLNENLNRQELPTAFIPNGAIFILKYDLLKKKYSYYSNKTYAYKMKLENSIDIDTQLDFEFAEFLMRKKK
ncbi:MAG: acylneuraminate cytidylyltransferase family protein [Bacteroidetes bacterium]|nr:acylneuraminate cytidylyltransferase family protein [Bacteroidota bacterium]